MGGRRLVWLNCLRKEDEYQSLLFHYPSILLVSGTRMGVVLRQTIFQYYRGQMGFLPLGAASIGINGGIAQTQLASYFHS